MSDPDRSLFMPGIGFDLNRNIKRQPDGWLVERGYMKQTFLDKDYGLSYNNSYVAAANFLVDYVNSKSPSFQLNRNYRVLFKDLSRGIKKNYIRITRPTGGYKLFEFQLVRDAQGVIMSSNLPEVISQANAWFLEERKNKEWVITSKNTERRLKNQKARSLFGREPIPTAFLGPRTK